MIGSMANHASWRSRSTEPVVGMGATELLYSDRHAYTIIKVTRCTITVQRDKATRSDSNGMSDCQSYDYAPDPNGKKVVVWRTKNGWSNKKRCFRLGIRDEYFDYSF